MNLDGNDNDVGSDWGQNEENRSSDVFDADHSHRSMNGNVSEGGDDAYDGGGERTSSLSRRHHLDHDVVMEGYTPLNFNMNEFVMMNDGSDGDSDDEEILDGDLISNGYYHMMGAPPRRVNGVKNSMLVYARQHDHDHDNDDDSSRSDTSDNGIVHAENHSDGGANSLESLEVPDDFHLLAERALRGLEVEHLSTLEMFADATSDISSYESASQITACLPSGQKSDSAEIQTVGDLFSDASETSQELSVQPIAEATESIRTKESKSLNPKPIDVNAIQKAMKSIRLKSPQLATSLDAGVLSSSTTSASDVATKAALSSIINFSTRIMEQSRDTQLKSHAIIPAVPLAAFRRVTPKAQSASANLTRSATLSEAMLRLWPLICFRKKLRATGIGISSQQQTACSSKTLTIHIVGADGVECSSEALVLKLVGPFVRWLNAALQSGILRESDGTGMTAISQLAEIDALLIVFSGPNLPTDMIDNILDLLPAPITPSSGLTSAKAVFHQREYHEGSSCTDCADAPLVDLVIAFNAGIWGYDSWKPTIECMLRRNNVDSPANGTKPVMGNTIFVITAYTLEESEDDAAVITDLVETNDLDRSMKPKNNSNAISQQIWGPELNPFSSRLERYTASAPPGRKYFENGAWQAWLLGG
jgi:hypothetical protein